MRIAGREIGAVLLGVVGAAVLFGRWSGWAAEPVELSVLGLLGVGIGFAWQVIQRRDPIRDLSILGGVAVVSMLLGLVAGLLYPENVSVHAEGLPAWFGFAVGMPLGYRWLERQARLRRATEQRS